MVKENDTMERILFSIVVPIYNKQQYIRECIDSLIPQVAGCSEGAEIILVDDGSTDASAQICDEYAMHYSNYIRVFHNANQGLLLTRRFGFLKAKGEYIINCDSDDFMESHAVSMITQTILKYGHPDVVFYNWWSYKSGNKEIGAENIFTNAEVGLVDRDIVRREFLSGIAVTSMCCKAIRRECLDIDCDYTRYKWISQGEDTLQTIPILKRATTFAYINKALYFYRLEDGMTRRFDAAYYAQFKRVYEQIYEQEDFWELQDFESLFAKKVLNMAARAITQSRHHTWGSILEQRRYLQSICEDSMFIHALIHFKDVQHDIKPLYRVMLLIMRYRAYGVLGLLLRV